MPLASAADGSSVEWDARLRYEHVDDEAFAADADAATLRLRAGLRFAGRAGWNGLLEGEAIATAGDFNSGANGRGQLPQVVDPRGIELALQRIGTAYTLAIDGEVLIDHKSEKAAAFQSIELGLNDKETMIYDVGIKLLAREPDKKP